MAFLVVVQSKSLSAQSFLQTISPPFSSAFCNNLSSNKEIGLIMNYLKINYAGVIEMSLAGKLAKEMIKK